ncbi:MAG: hypothetical protein KAI74_00785 [Kiritimatiellae bacterium]|nr:hypothetical protein [Kiritimatiellia bacterium]
MKRKISWTTKLEGGVKREVRVEVKTSLLRWQQKRTDEESWVYDFVPDAEDWDALEDILNRRSGRGRYIELAAVIHKLRLKAGV